MPSKFFLKRSLNSPSKGSPSLILRGRKVNLHGATVLSTPGRDLLQSFHRCTFLQNFKVKRLNKISKLID